MFIGAMVFLTALAVNGRKKTMDSRSTRTTQEGVSP
jgi:hypothetical protein